MENSVAKDSCPKKVDALGILTARFILLNVAAPVLLGGLIYTVWRKPTLLVFSWYRHLGMGSAVFWLRDEVRHISVPGWARFNLPDGLWVYAFTAFMAGLWGGTAGKARVGWMSVGLVLAISGELGQYIGIVEGTFDLLDIAFCAAAFLLALLVVNAIRKGEFDEPRDQNQNHCVCCRGGSVLRVGPGQF